MRRVSNRSIAFCLLLLFVGAPARADDAVVSDGTNLLKQGDKLADEGKYAEAVIRYKSGMEKLLPSLRKIPFKHEVKRDVTKRENMKEMILKEIDEDMTPEEFRANELAMKAFGLLPLATTCARLWLWFTRKRSPHSTIPRQRRCT